MAGTRRGGPPAEAGTPLTLYLVKQLELAVRARMDDVLRPTGLTPLQYTALTVLRHRDRLSSAQLARRSFVRPQSMHEMVTALEQRGLIVRHQEPGNRRVLVASLTPAARDLLAGCEPVVREIEEDLLAGMGTRQRADFRRGLAEGRDRVARKSSR